MAGLSDQSPYPFLSRSLFQCWISSSLCLSLLQTTTIIYVI